MTDVRTRHIKQLVRGSTRLPPSSPTTTSLAECLSNDCLTMSVPTRCMASSGVAKPLWISGSSYVSVRPPGVLWTVHDGSLELMFGPKA